jgi:hypothetical protein
MRSPTCVVLLAVFAAAAAALTGGAAAQKEPSANKDGGEKAADGGVPVVYGAGQRLGPRRGVVENKHSTDVEAPPLAPHACVSLHHGS